MCLHLYVTIGLDATSTIVNIALDLEVTEPKPEHVQHMATNVEQNSTAPGRVEAKLIHCLPREGITVFDGKAPDISQRAARNAFPSHSDSRCFASDESNRNVCTAFRSS